MLPPVPPLSPGPPACSCRAMVLAMGTSRGGFAVGHPLDCLGCAWRPDKGTSHPTPSSTDAAGSDAAAAMLARLERLDVGRKAAQPAACVGVGHLQARPSRRGLKRRWDLGHPDPWVMGPHPPSPTQRFCTQACWPQASGDQPCPCCAQPQTHLVAVLEAFNDELPQVPRASLQHVVATGPGSAPGCSGHRLHALTCVRQA